MKQYLLVLMFALMGTGTASAQTEVKDTYVHSEQGFKWRIGSFKTDNTVSTASTRRTAKSWYV